MIKGSSNGITVVLDNDMQFEELLDNISEKFKNASKFFNNANMAISFNGRDLSSEEEKRILDIISEVSDLNIVCVLDNDNEIKEVYEKENYLMDTHTAVGYVVLNKYKNETGDNRQALIVSTASPYKFPRSICRALGLDVSNKNDFEVLKLLNEYTNIEIPNNLKGLDVKKVIHNKVCNKEKMKESLLEFLKENKN